MFNSTVLEVALGLVMVYLLLSLVCSAVNEFITRILQWRSTTLKQGVETMLEGLMVVKDNTSQGVAGVFFNSPLIRGLNQLPGTFGGSEIVSPTYIPAQMFSRALLDILAPATAETPRSVATVRDSIAHLPDSDLKASLLGMVDRAGNDLEKAHAHIEHWFDTTMEEVSACYRAWANFLLFFVAVGVCAVMNADSLKIAGDLWTNPALRAAMVASAEKVASEAPKEGQATQTPKEQLQSVQAALAGVELPLGWNTNEFKGLFDCSKLTATLEKLFGIFFTAVAVSLGAPFWFDLLNKLVNFRAAAKKPKPAQTATNA